MRVFTKRQRKTVDEISGTLRGNGLVSECELIAEKLMGAVSLTGRKGKITQ